MHGIIIGTLVGVEAVKSAIMEMIGFGSKADLLTPWPAIALKKKKVPPQDDLPSRVSWLDDASFVDDSQTLANQHDRQHNASFCCFAPRP